MQRWSKFQFQSKILEKKILFIIFSIALISILPQVFAEDDLDALLAEKNAVLIEQQKIIFEIGKHSDVHVKHVIETGAWSKNTPRVIEILSGTQTNLIVADEDGDRLSFSFDRETFEDSEYIILNQKLLGYDLIVEYDLENFMELKNGLWSKEIQLPFDVMVMFDDEIEMIFGNSRPIDVSSAKGINCVGCNLLIEIFDDEKSIVKEISSNDKKYNLEFFSNGNISNLTFMDEVKMINFDVYNEDQLIVLKIPFTLLLNPFDVYFTDDEDTELNQIDKIRKSEFSQNETHVNLSFRTSGDGVVSIIGANMEDHEKLLEKINKMKPVEKVTEVMEEKVMINESEELSFADKLQEQQTDEIQYNIIIIIGIVILAVIIIGIIVKIKRN